MIKRRPGLRRLVTWAAWTYLALLVVTLLSLRFVGEGWWLTGMALYFPRLLFLLPWFVLAPCAFALKLPRVLWTQIAAGALAVFPLMGFVAPHPRANATGPQIRLLSLNVNSCAAGAERLAARASEYEADVVLFQELCQYPRAVKAQLGETYPYVQSAGQFLIASKFPVSNPKANDPGYLARKFDGRFTRYELDTPLGRIAVYNMHPISPRWAFYAAKGMRVRTSLRDGSFMRGGAAEESLRDNFRWRESQLAAAVEQASLDPMPRILAGDTNLPNLSPLLPRYLANYQDGFERAGWGFGYTYPSRLPWMRIDRIFASKDLRFVSFKTGCDGDSDHRCVFASIERAAE